MDYGLMKMEAVTMVDGVYIRALPMSPPLTWLLSFDPRALDDPISLPNHSLKAKEVVGTNRDEIHEESHHERQLSVLCGVQMGAQMTTHGRTKRHLSY